MANYNIVVDTSNFKPFTFQEKIAPYLLYKEDYQKYEDKLEKLAEENGEIALPLNSKYRGVLDRFNEDYAALVNDFSNGMNYKNRALAIKIFQRSKKEMTPLRKMVEAYNKDVDLMNATKLNDPTAIITYTPSIDDYYGGVKTSKVQSISGKQVAAEVAVGTKAILDSMGQDYKFQSTLASGLLKAIKTGQIDISSLYNMANNPNTPIDVASDARTIAQTLLLYFSSTYQRYGYNNPGMTGENRTKLQYYINQGALAGMSPSETSIVEDKSYITPYQNKQLELDAARIAASKQEATDRLTESQNEHYDQVMLSSGYRKTLDGTWEVAPVTLKDVPSDYIDEDVDASGNPTTDQNKIVGTRRRYITRAQGGGSSTTPSQPGGAAGRSTGHDK